MELVFRKGGTIGVTKERKLEIEDVNVVLNHLGKKGSVVHVLVVRIEMTGEIEIEGTEIGGIEIWTDEIEIEMTETSEIDETGTEKTTEIDETEKIGEVGIEMMTGLRLAENDHVPDRLHRM
jgi:hypothetical protein